MRCLRIYATPDGESQIDEIDIPTIKRRIFPFAGLRVGRRGDEIGPHEADLRRRALSSQAWTTCHLSRPLV